MNAVLSCTKAEQIPFPVYQGIINLIATTKEFQDTTFVIKSAEETIRFPFNRALFLATSSSPYLKALAGAFREGQSSEITLNIQDQPEKTARSLQQCLAFCYTRTPVSLTDDNVVDVLACANYLDIKEVKSTCENQINERKVNIKVDANNYKDLFVAATTCFSSAPADAVFQYLFKELSNIKDIDLSKESENELVRSIWEMIEIEERHPNGTTQKVVYNLCQRIDLRDCDPKRIDDSFLQFLSICCPNLRSLTLPNGAQVTNAGLAHLATLTQLQVLNLEWCNKITDAGKNELRLSLPQCAL